MIRKLWFLVPLLMLAGCGDELADCPGAQPASVAACSAAGLTCYYGAIRCACTGGTWQCGAGDMAVPDLAPAHDMAETD